MEVDIIDPVLSRRSIRKYQKRNLKELHIHRLLNAGMSAPSADDERPWHFIIVQENALKRELSESWPLAHILKDAPVCFVVCGDELLQKQQGCWMLDCAAATQNMLIEAHYLGLGAVWLGIYPVEGRIQRVRSILGAPRSIIPFAIIPVGYSDEIKEPQTRYDERRVHFQRWKRV